MAKSTPIISLLVKSLIITLGIISLVNSCSPPEEKAISFGKDTMYFANEVKFHTNSDSLLTSSYQALDIIAAKLIADSTIGLKIVVHTDNMGTSYYNKRLTEKQAFSIEDYLVSTGINEKRVFSMGAGSEDPIVANITKEGREKNRRVEIKFVDIEAITEMYENTKIVSSVEFDTSYVLENIKFASNTDKLLSYSHALLDTLVTQLRHDLSLKIEVISYTSGDGNLRYNRRLSQKRADANKDYIVGGKVESFRVIAKGEVDEQPAVSNENSSNTINQRFEVRYIRP